MLRIFLTIVATLSVVFAAWCIDGFYMQQGLLFWSGFLMAGILFLSNERS